MKLLQDERVAKLMQDERVMKTMMNAMQKRAELQDTLDARLEKVAHSLNFATKKELRELKRGMRKMERELARAKKDAAAAKAQLEERDSE